MKSIFIFILFFPAIIFCQDSLHSSKAVLFGINDFHLDTFNGGAGIKTWTSEDFALTGKIKASYSRNEREKTQYLNGNTDKSYLLGFSFGIEKHFSLLSKASPYFGTNIGIGYDFKSTQVNSSAFPGMYYTNEQITKNLTFNINLSFGIEYFISKGISLGGQYNFGAEYGRGSEELKVPYSDGTEVKTKILNLGISSGELILAVYF